MSHNPFDDLAERYDAWFDSREGRPIFEAETACLRSLMPADCAGWLEVGVGTGRFAEALGVRIGVDVSAAVLEFAARRGIRALRGRAEVLPYADATFDGVLMVGTLCFLSDPAKALRECARVLKPDGQLVVGLVPAGSSWGKLYAEKGRRGHAFWSAAKFHACDQVARMAAEAGLSPAGAMSCLFTKPGDPIPCADRPQQGTVKNAGFVAMRFVRSNAA